MRKIKCPSCGKKSTFNAAYYKTFGVSAPATFNPKTGEWSHDEDNEEMESDCLDVTEVSYHCDNCCEAYEG